MRPESALEFIKYAITFFSLCFSFVIITAFSLVFNSFDNIFFYFQKFYKIHLITVMLLVSAETVNNDRQHLAFTSYTPGILPNALHVLSCLILIVSLGKNPYFSPPFYT